MSKFKVGDRVRVIAGALCGEEDTIAEDWGANTYSLSRHPNNAKLDVNLELVSPRLESNVWYKSAEHKLQAEEIEGRIVLDYYTDLSKKLRLITYLPIVYSAEETVNGMYSGLNTDCKQYMLIDPAPQEEEPMEFEGVKPTIESNDSGCWVQYRHGKVDICTGICESKELTIETWNEWVKEHTK